jgi:hypothetical protein
MQVSVCGTESFYRYSFTKSCQDKENGGVENIFWVFLHTDAEPLPPSRLPNAQKITVATSPPSQGRADAGYLRERAAVGRAPDSCG